MLLPYRRGIVTNVAALYAASAGGGYSTEATALFARMSVQPDATRKGLINTLILGLIASGDWARDDVLYVLAAHDSQAALLNWKSAAGDAALAHTSGSTDATFTTDRGFTGNTTTHYINTNYNPTSFSGHVYLEDDAHITMWSLTNTTDSNWRDVGQLATGSTGLCTVMNARSASANTLRGILNESAGFTDYSGVSDARGMFSFNRRNTVTDFLDAYQNGVLLATGTSSTTGIPNSNLTLLGDVSTASRLSGRQEAMFSAGATRTGTQELAYYNLLRTYMTAVGVP